MKAPTLWLTVGLYTFLYAHIASSVCHAHWDGAYMRHADDGFLTRYNWMDEVQDHVQLSEMALPGTHNSAAYIKLPSASEIVNAFYNGINRDWRSKGPFDSLNNIKDIICIDMQANQVLSIRQQLQYGIRVFDVNLVYYENRFGLIHKEKNTFLDLQLDQFLNQIANFLTEHPSETVLLMLAVKQEIGENDKSLSSKLREYLQDSRISQFYFQTNNGGVTLGEARGKFIIISKDINFNEFGLDGNGDDFVITNNGYLNTNWDLYWKKWIPVKEHLETASSESKNTFYIDFLSGYGGSFPYFVASGHSSPWTSAPRLSTGLTTPGWRYTYPDFPRVTCFIGICTIAFEGTNILTRDKIKAYNEELQNQHRSVGIVMADFPGDSLIETVINNNALLKKSLLSHSIYLFALFM